MVEPLRTRIQEIQPELLEHFSHLVATDKLYHAYLFSGGYGSFEMALYLAQAISCPNTHDGLPDGNCRVCQLIEQGEFADFHVVKPEGQSIKIEQVRELLREFATTGLEIDKKVIVVQNAERLTINAANALLKAIEEPEADTYIFLLTTNENRLLPTILSRVQTVYFHKNKEQLTASLEAKGILKTEAEFAAELSNSTEEALALVQSPWFSEGLKKLSQWTNLALTAPDDAFLYLSSLTEIFEDKQQQETAFALILILFNQMRQKAIGLTAKTFRAVRYFHANVNFRAALESILL